LIFHHTGEVLVFVTIWTGRKAGCVVVYSRTITRVALAIRRAVAAAFHYCCTGYAYAVITDDRVSRGTSLNTSTREKNKRW